MSLETAERAAIADGWMRAAPLWAIIAETGQPLRTIMAVVREMGLPERDPCTCEPIGGTVVMEEADAPAPDT
jgi:hypothetical protein